MTNLTGDGRRSLTRSDWLGSHVVGMLSREVLRLAVIVEDRPEVCLDRAVPGARRSTRSVDAAPFIQHWKG